MTTLTNVFTHSTQRNSGLLNYGQLPVNDSPLFAGKRKAWKSDLELLACRYFRISRHSLAAYGGSTFDPTMFNAVLNLRVGCTHFREVYLIMFQLFRYMFCCAIQYYDEGRYYKCEMHKYC